VHAGKLNKNHRYYQISIYSNLIVVFLNIFSAETEVDDTKVESKEDTTEHPAGLQSSQGEYKPFKITFFFAIAIH